jgi:peroxiredoxin family protein
MKHKVEAIWEKSSAQLKHFILISSFARKEMAKAGHLPPQDKLEQLKELGAHIDICGGSMDPFGVKKSDSIFDDVIVAEYLTFLEIMDNTDIHIFLP